MARVRMIGGPKDGRSYDYPDPPDVLVFQRFDLDMNAYVDNYRRRRGTRDYYWTTTNIYSPRNEISDRFEPR